MHGRIKRIDVNNNTRFQFYGEIYGNDGKTYRFNDYNWADKAIRLEDIDLDAEVEFDLKEPTDRGWVYPKNIRFRSADHPAPTSDEFRPSGHNHGLFQKFVFVNTEKILALLDALIPDFATTEYATPNSLFRKLATTYNELDSSDFHYSGYQNNEAVTFPTGLMTPAGEDVLLYCTPNRISTIPWYAEQLCIDGKTLGSVFNWVHANWYDIEQSVLDLLPDCRDSAQELVQKIDQRCLQAEAEMIYLKQGLSASKEEADELYLPTGYFKEDGAEIFLLCRKRGGGLGFGWYFISATYANAGFRIFDKKMWLEKWSGPLQFEQLQALANQTLKEEWSFSSKENFGILRSYLQYTFSHQVEENNLEFDADQQYAAFNTGLPDRNTYKYLYAVFERQSDQVTDLHPLYCKPEYSLQGFVVPGRGGLGKVLSEKIGLPQPPTYFQNRTETVWQLGFNESNQITIPEYDDIHILIQRCDRIPLEFYRSQAINSPVLMAILEAEEPDAEKYKKIRDFFKPVVTNYEPDDEVTNVYRKLQSALENVISIAVKKLAWNWRAVVPCYNPELGESCFLLPVSFSEDEQPDRAVIASCNETNMNNIYTIHTVIFLHWAYLDARLICRPESEWLVVDHIEDEENN